jgi:hypothetical protein
MVRQAHHDNCCHPEPAEGLPKGNNKAELKHLLQYNPLFRRWRNGKEQRILSQKTCLIT